jgi:anti-sigma factor RsiW
MTTAHDHGSAECLEMLERLSEYLDGDADPALSAEIERHMAGCEPCVAFLRSLRNTVAEIGDVPRPRLPDDVRRACAEAHAKLRGGR